MEFFSRDTQAGTWFTAGTQLAKVATPVAATAVAKFPNPAGSYKVELKGDVTRPPKLAEADDPAWWLGPNNKLPKVVRLVAPHTTVKAVFKDLSGKPVIAIDDILRRHTNLDQLLGPGDYLVDFLDPAGNKIKLTLDVDTTLTVKLP